MTRYLQLTAQPWMGKWSNLYPQLTNWTIRITYRTKFFFYILARFLRFIWITFLFLCVIAKKQRTMITSCAKSKCIIVIFELDGLETSFQQQQCIFLDSYNSTKLWLLLKTVVLCNLPDKMQRQAVISLYGMHMNVWLLHWTNESVPKVLKKCIIE